MNGKRLSQLGVAAKQKIAAERLERVRELQKQGLTAPQIVEVLKNDYNQEWTLRTIHQDFCKLKAEREKSENTEKDR